MLAALAPLIGAGISAASSLFGGKMAKDSADETRRQQLALAEQNRQDQITFAKEGLTWKIDDAMRNADRVHPIYSLGSAGASFTPVSANFTSDTSMPNALASAGQDIGRAVNATATASQKSTALSALQLEGISLDNDLKRAEIASKVGRLRQNATPAFPVSGDAGAYEIPGQGNSPLIKSKPLEVAPSPVNAPSVEGGAIADTGYARTTTGWAPVPSKDVKERIEDNIPQEVMHWFRNNLLPTFGYNRAPPPGIKLKDDERWIFHFPTQEYRIVPKNSNQWNIR